MLHIAYIAALFVLLASVRRDAREATIALAALWLVQSSLWVAWGGTMHLGLWMATDFATGTWLLASAKRGSPRWCVGLCFIPILAINGFVLALGEPAWRDNAITVGAWAQMIVLFAGAWNDGFGSLYNNIRHRLFSGRSDNAGLPFMVSGGKEEAR